MQKNKKNKIKSSTNNYKRIIIEITLFIMGVLIFFFIIALVSFNPSDSSWSQKTSNIATKNLAGSVGAYVVDILFISIGMLGYSIPLLMIIIFIKILKHIDKQNHIDFFILSLRFISMITLLISSCALFTLNVDDLAYFSSGGIIGSIVSNAILPLFNILGTTLMLSCIWILSLTLFIGFSWINTIEKIGEVIFKIILMMKKYIIAFYNQHKTKTLNSYIPNYPNTFSNKNNVQKSKFEDNSNENILFSDLAINESSNISKKISNNLNEKQMLGAKINQFIIPNKKNNTAIQLKMSKINSGYSNKEKKNINKDKLFFLSEKIIKTNNKTNHKITFKYMALKIKNKIKTLFFSNFIQFLTYKRIYKKIFNKQKTYLLKNLFKKKIDKVFFLNPNKNKKILHKNLSRNNFYAKKIKSHNFLDSKKEVLSESIDKNMPSLKLLIKHPTKNKAIDVFLLNKISRIIEEKLMDYRIKAEVVGFSVGPVITRFELNLAPGVKAIRVSNLSRDLARSLLVTTVRIVDIIPGKPYLGLELPNKKRHTVFLREVLDCDMFRCHSSPLTIVLGKDIEGKPVIADLKKMPHLLVAGTTGSGKSVWLNAMIISILYKAKPKDVRFIMIDPKMLELSTYEGIPHLLTKVITNMQNAFNALHWCIHEMERRYKIMSALGVKNLSSYNKKILTNNNIPEKILQIFISENKTNNIKNSNHGSIDTILKTEPYIVIIIDEFADLIMTSGKPLEDLIVRLTQKARAAGIHLIVATQRPSVDVITGLIKANIPTRIAFTVSSKIDSRTILDQNGAESLLGMGDMLYLPSNSSIPIRVHGAFVQDQEVKNVVKDWKKKEKPNYIDHIINNYHTH
ncbi:MAG: DNA translocase FtsK 4TM domain-containing protein [Arsenophonus sp.]|nr:MAG: DNA translocase FtsK 4TM domain-containing protein [Arsenophonus sp.]